MRRLRDAPVSEGCCSAVVLNHDNTALNTTSSKSACARRQYGWLNRWQAAKAGACCMLCCQCMFLYMSTTRTSCGCTGKPATEPRQLPGLELPCKACFSELEHRSTPPLLVAELIGMSFRCCQYSDSLQAGVASSVCALYDGAAHECALLQKMLWARCKWFLYTIHSWSHVACLTSYKNGRSLDTYASWPCNTFSH